MQASGKSSGTKNQRGESSSTKNQRGESSGTVTWKTAVAEIVNGTQNTVQDEGDGYFCFRLDYLTDTFE